MTTLYGVFSRILLQRRFTIDRLDSCRQTATVGLGSTRRERRLVTRFQRLRGDLVNLPGREAVALLTENVGRLRTNHEVALFAEDVLETFVNTRGVEMRDDVATALRRSPDLRQAYRGSIVSIPADVDDELRAIAARV